MNCFKKVINYRLSSSFNSGGIKVRTVLIFCLICIVFTPIVSSYDDSNLISIAVSEDKTLCAYISNGYKIPSTLYVANSNGTLLFEYKFTSEETGGGYSKVWFEGESICVYTFRKKLLIVFKKDGCIEIKKEMETFDNLDGYMDFKKEFSCYSHKFDKGEYRYTNVDFFSSFLLRKPRELIFIDDKGNEFLIWSGAW